MRIVIEKLPNGHLNIESGAPGPMSTIRMLRDVIAAIESGTCTAELQAAHAGVAIPSAEQTRQLTNGHK